MSVSLVYIFRICQKGIKELRSPASMNYKNSIYCNSNFSVRCVRKYTNRNILKLSERGMYHDVFPADSNQKIIDLLNVKPQCVYAGFDPTANSLHVGNLLVLMNLLHWQRAGHAVIVLIGGTTGLIGDPSGKTSARVKLSKAFIDDNVQAIKMNISQMLKNHEAFLLDSRHSLQPFKFVNNSEWYRDLTAVDFVNQIGRRFRMGTMLSRHSVKTRLESDSGMSFTEFCYQIFQAYDWLQLLRKYNCRFQVGGNDQMGNIMSGQDLISRVENTSVYGLTLPLLTTESGSKFGKSDGNAVWLQEAKTSPFQLYQFFIRTRDDEVEKLLKLFTFESLDSISRLLEKHKMEPEKRYAQLKLAEQVTLLVHGEAGLSSALDTTKALYEKNIHVLGAMAPGDLTDIFDGASSSELMLEPGMTTLQLATAAKCFPTLSDALRIISAGGFYINYQRITNCDEVLRQDVHVLPNNVSILRVGKRNYHIVKWLRSV